jgi:hypothetical protein
MDQKPPEAGWLECGWAHDAAALPDLNPADRLPLRSERVAGPSRIALRRWRI